MNIMHEPHAIVWSSLTMYVRRRAQAEFNANGGNGLQNKRVIILGGSSGIALASADQAAKIVIGSSNAERLIGGEALGQAVDVSDEAFETFFTRLGAFDHLVFTTER